jgi:hypothetical protein
VLVGQFFEIFEVEVKQSVAGEEFTFIRDVNIAEMGRVLLNQRYDLSVGSRCGFRGFAFDQQ